MKITIYELLGMVKDGKLPKMIKYRFQSEFVKFCVETLFELLRDAAATLYDEVEILDDEEKGLPEKIKITEKSITVKGTTFFRDKDIEIFQKLSMQINEIIDYLEKQSKGE